MNTTSIIWAIGVTVAVILLGWLGSVLDAREHQRLSNHLHNR